MTCMSARAPRERGSARPTPNRSSGEHAPLHHPHLVRDAATPAQIVPRLRTIALSRTRPCKPRWRWLQAMDVAHRVYAPLELHVERTLVSPDAHALDTVRHTCRNPSSTCDELLAALRRAHNSMPFGGALVPPRAHLLARRRRFSWFAPWMSTSLSPACLCSAQACKCDRSRSGRRLRGGVDGARSLRNAGRAAHGGDGLNGRIPRGAR
jgi:hypothetical protein